MRYMILCITLGILTSWPLCLQAQASKASLNITIEGVKSTKGNLMMALFSQEDGFPFTHQKAYKLKQMAAPSGTVAVTFNDLPPGRYAFAVYHDANADGKLNTNVFGVPNEGYGFSNNVRPKFSAPDFDDAAFTLGASKQLRISVKY